MASFLSVGVGPITGRRDYVDDVKVQETLEQFALARNLWAPGATLTNQQKMNAIIAEIEAEVVRKARNYRLNTIYQEAIPTVDEEIDLS